MLRRIGIVLFVVVVAVSLVACGNKAKSSGGSASASKQAVTLNFWTLSLQPTYTDYINGVIAAYESSHPNVKVKWTDLPWDGYQEKLISQIAGNNAPDVVNIWTTLVLGLAGQGALVNLKKEATPAQLAVYEQNLMKSNEMQGGTYGFPWYVTPPIETYNKALFAKAGLQHPPTDYAQMFEMAPIMKQKTGAYLYFPNDMSQVLYANGIKILNPSKTAAAFNTPKALALLEKLKKGVDAGYIPRTGWNNWNNMIKLYAQKKLALISLGSQTVSRLKHEAPGIMSDTEVGPPLLGSAGIAEGALQSLSIPKASHHHSQAIDFAAFVANSENELAFCKLAAIMPTTVAAAKDPFFTSNLKTLSGRARAEAAKASAVSFDLALGVDKESQITSAVDGMFQAIMQANQNPKTVLATTAKQVDQLLKK